MTMSWAMIVLAVASFGAHIAQAQDQLGRRRVVSVSGCLAQAERTGSLTDDTGAGNVPSPNTAGVEANSSEPLNAYILLNATPAADGSGVHREAGARTSYALPCNANLNRPGDGGETGVTSRQSVSPRLLAHWSPFFTRRVPLS
jgi:hypothetical protein